MRASIVARFNKLLKVSSTWPILLKADSESIVELWIIMISLVTIKSIGYL